MLTAWKRSPMLRLFLPFAVGIFFALHHEIYLVPTVVIGGIVLPFIFFWIVKRRALPYRFRMLPPLAIMLLMGLLGALITALSDPRHSETHFSHHPEDQLHRVRLLDVPAKKEKSWKVFVEVISAGDSIQMRTGSGKVLLYLAPCEALNSLMVDDEIIISAKIQDLSPPLNPNVFDYRQYLMNHGIHGQCYADSLSWMRTFPSERHSLTGYFRILREYLLQQLTSHQIDEREADVLAALVLGKTTGLDEELMTSYAGAGAVHVLAVSGLHVALIYMILSPILKRVFRGNRARWTKTLLPVFLLWAYAGITGFSPSVLRSALMFTCFIIADNFQKQNNIFNTMSVSAMLLLISEPCMISEAGFQLSYLAVLGIVIYQDPLVHLIYVKNKFLLWAWKLTCVSTAAQLATLPVTLFYFHQFPNYFILTNLLVIPISTIVLYAGLAYFVLYAIPWINHHLAHIAAMLTRVMNDIMIAMSEWPGSVTMHIDITPFESMVITFLVITSASWILFRHVRSALWTMAFILTLLVCRNIEVMSILDQKVVCFHHVKDGFVISAIRGDSCRIVSSSDLSGDVRTQKFVLNGYLDHKGIDLLSFYTVNDSTNHLGLLDVNNLQVLVLNENNVALLDFTPWDVIYFDRKSSAIKFTEEALNAMRVSTLIFSQGFSKEKLNFIREQLPNTNIHDLSKGAVICDLTDTDENSECVFRHFTESQ